MATDPLSAGSSQYDFGFPAQDPAAATSSKPERGFAGFTTAQIAIGGLALLALIWAMWTTHEVLALRQHKVVAVRLGELVNRFALAEARSGDEPEKVVARTRAYMTALDKALKDRSVAGQVILVGEAVVSSSTEDITATIAAEVAGEVSMPVALALPPRGPVAPVATPPLDNSSPGAGGVGGSSAAGSPFAAAAAAAPVPLPYAQGAGDPSAQEPDNAQQ